MNNVPAKLILLIVAVVLARRTSKGQSFTLHYWARRTHLAAPYG